MASLAFASPAESQPPPPGSESPFGIGFQGSFPAYGLSGIYDASETVTVQAVLGAFGTLTSFGGRLLFDFQQEEKYALYGFGSVGLWRYGLVGETSIGVGGGAGIELDWQSIIDPEERSFPPLFSTIDLGLTLASFDAYNFSVFTMGVGLHYRF